MLKPRIRVGAVIVKENSLLLVKHQDKGQFWWTLPGGGLENDESLQQCVIREAHEEVALDVTCGRLVAVRQYISEEYQINQTELYFICMPKSHDVSRKNLAGKNDEHSICELKWVPFAELKNYNLLPNLFKDFNFNSKDVVYVGPEYDQHYSESEFNPNA